MRWLWGLTLAVAFATPAGAEWHQASSEHFVIYADDSPRDIQRFGEMLERYHAAMGLLTGREVATPSPSNRLTIFAVGGESDMRALSGSRQIAGFYVPRAGRSRAFVPNIRVTNGEPDFSMIVLMHEYAHHFLIASSRWAMPYWLSEGAAEFFASARFPEDGSVHIGRPAFHRAGEFQYAANIPAEILLQAKPGEDAREAFYGRSWLLYHFLSFDPGRKGQLDAYWRAVASGTPSREAATKVFGDLAVLDRELGRYLRQRKMQSFNLSPAAVPIGPVTVQPVSEGMDTMMPHIIVSQRGVDRQDAAELLPKVRQVAARYPDDPHVLAALAEAEFDAGNNAETITAADRALALDPTIENALVQKGYALFRMAESAADQDAAYKAAMAPFTALNRLENDHPLPLIYFYRSLADRGAETTELARHALERAAELAPFDQNLWMNAALMEASEGRIEIAQDNLAPLAANPHGGELAESATLLMSALAAVAEGQAFDGVSYLAAARSQAPDAGGASAEGAK